MSSYTDFCLVITHKQTHTHTHRTKSAVYLISTECHVQVEESILLPVFQFGLAKRKKVYKKERGRKTQGEKARIIRESELKRKNARYIRRK